MTVNVIPVVPLLWTFSIKARSHLLWQRQKRRNFCGSRHFVLTNFCCHDEGNRHCVAFVTAIATVNGPAIIVHMASLMASSLRSVFIEVLSANIQLGGKSTGSLLLSRHSICAMVHWLAKTSLSTAFDRMLQHHTATCDHVSLMAVVKWRLNPAPYGSKRCFIEVTANLRGF